MKKQYKYLLFTLFIHWGPAIGQVLQPGTFDFEYYKLLLSKNDFENEPIGYFPAIITDSAPDSTLGWAVWKGYLQPASSGRKISIVEPTTGTVFNSRFHRSYNDGPVWNGKGLNSWISTGIYGKISTGNQAYVSYTFAPIAYFAQNSDFFIPSPEFEKSLYSYPYYQKLDQVERYGDGVLLKVHPGQSEVKFVYRKIAIGASTQNTVWGPAMFNPILMSQQAAGIPQINLGFNNPVDTKIGRLEGKVFWGVLRESDYYDSNPNNNKRYITGFSGGYAPSFIKGLSLGLHRVMYRLWQTDSLGVKDAFAAVLNTSSKYNTPLNGVLTNDVYDQMASITIRWNHPQTGIEIYTEYARNDFPGDWREFARNPDRSRAITIGVNEVFETNRGHTIKFSYENTTLSANQLQLFNTFSSPTYYVHNFLDHGYTNNGQIIGAGIGPGSNSHIFQGLYFTGSRMFGLSAQRIRFNDDYILRKYAGALRYPSEGEIVYSGRYQHLFGRFTIELQAQYAKHYNWYFLTSGTKRNFQSVFNIRYRFDQ